MGDIPNKCFNIPVLQFEKQNIDSVMALLGGYHIHFQVLFVGLGFAHNGVSFPYKTAKFTT